MEKISNMMKKNLKINKLDVGTKVRMYYVFLDAFEFIEEYSEMNPYLSIFNIRRFISEVDCFTWNGKIQKNDKEFWENVRLEGFHEGLRRIREKNEKENFSSDLQYETELQTNIFTIYLIDQTFHDWNYPITATELKLLGLSERHCFEEKEYYNKLAHSFCENGIKKSIK